MEQGGSIFMAHIHIGYHKVVGLSRGPVKKFQDCIQMDTKKVEKLTKCASRVKYC